MEPIYKNPDTNNKNIHVKVSPNNKWYFLAFFLLFNLTKITFIHILNELTTKKDYKIDLITLRDERSNGEKIENNDSQKKRKYK